MTRLLICLLVFNFAACLAQDDYSARLAKRLDEMVSKRYNNNVVMFNDTTNNPAGYDTWNPNTKYIQTDRVQFKGKDYEAIGDSHGKQPLNSPNDWAQMPDYHPYRFLRDTAKTEDLIRLALPGNHPYVKTYAIGALSFRGHENIYQLVTDNFSDTIVIHGWFGDTGFELCPADLMLSYTIKGFSSTQKDNIKKKIITEHSHLKSLDNALRFHRPSEEVYPLVKRLLEKGIATPFALVALSTYKKPEDIVTIRNRFRNLDEMEQSRNGGLFYKAIENFPSPEFMKDLKDNRKGWNMNFFQWDRGYYYINALAVYRSKEFLKILGSLVSQKKTRKEHHHSIYYDNQSYIFRALEKYYCPMYDDLLKKIQQIVPKDFDLRNNWYNPDKDPWN